MSSIVKLTPTTGWIVSNTGKIQIDPRSCCRCNCKNFWRKNFRCTLTLECPDPLDPCLHDTKDVTLVWNEALKYWTGHVTGWACTSPSEFDVDVVCTAEAPTLPPGENESDLIGCNRPYVLFMRVNGSNWFSQAAVVDPDCTTLYARWGSVFSGDVLGCTLSSGGIGWVEIWYP